MKTKRKPKAHDIEDGFPYTLQIETRRAAKRTVKKGDLLTADTINALHERISRLERAPVGRFVTHPLPVAPKPTDKVTACCGGGGGTRIISFDLGPASFGERMPSNHGLPWAPQHVRFMLDQHDRGIGLTMIAEQIHRTPFAVFAKLLKEGNQFDAMKRNALTEDNVYRVMAEIAVGKGLVKWA